jgi:small-conductance mechanosensitive channel
LRDSAQSTLFTLGRQDYSLTDLVILIGLTIAIWFGVRALTQVIKTRILVVSGANRGFQEALAALIQYSLAFLGLFGSLQLWGIDLSSLAILASVLGVGIGFGLQTIVNNFVSGLVILLERPIQVGDFINIDDLVGTVEKIGARSTEIRTLDQISIIVPNADFINSKVINWSHGHPTIRIRLPVGVAYGSDIEQVKTALLEAAKRHPKVLGYPAPFVLFTEFGDSALHFLLIVSLRDPRSQFIVASELNQLIAHKFEAYQIAIPFPQRDVHLRSPQIEQAIEAWIRQQVTPEPQLYYPQPIRKPSIRDSTTVEPASAPPTTLKSSAQRRFGARPQVDLDELTTQMRGPEGLEIKDRRYRLSTYRHCFIGAEAVEWLMTHCDATHHEALQIGQMLIDRGVIHHVTDDHSFEDAYLFYRFYVDEIEA